MLIWVFALVLAAALIARDCPHVPLGRALHRFLVEAPAAWLTDFSFARAVATLAIVAMVIAAPEFALLIGADMTLFLEALAATGLIAAQVRFADLLKHAVALPRRIVEAVRRPAPGASRQGSGPRPVRRRSPPPIDPEPAGFAFA